MTSTKTFYFTTVLRTIFTERKADGPGDQPAYDDIATFDDFWTVRFLNHQTSFLLCFMYLFSYIFRLWADLLLIVYLIKSGTMEKI